MPQYRKGRFDHGPTKGGKDEGAKYDVQYGINTLQLYEYLFGKSSEDMWEPNELRFSPIWFCHFHLDLRRVASYMITVEKAKGTF